MQKFLITDLYQQIKEVLLSPVKFWQSSKSEETSTLQLFWYYYLPLVLAASVATFIGTWMGSSHFYVGNALLKAIHQLIIFILQYFISVYLVNELMKTFGGEKNIIAAKQLVVYSLTPYILVSIVTGLFSALYIVDILGLYGFYIFLTGVKELLKLPERKQSSYILISIFLNLFVFAFLSILFWKIFMAFY